MPTTTMKEKVKTDCAQEGPATGPIHRTTSKALINGGSSTTIHFIVSITIAVFLSVYFAADENTFKLNVTSSVPTNSLSMTNTLAGAYSESHTTTSHPDTTTPAGLASTPKSTSLYEELGDNAMAKVDIQSRTQSVAPATFATSPSASPAAAHSATPDLTPSLSPSTMPSSDSFSPTSATVSSAGRYMTSATTENVRAQHGVSTRSSPINRYTDYNNHFKLVDEEPVSTFSVDVDTSSYSFLRRAIQQYGQLPPLDTIRLEELINYFDYDYPQPSTSDVPFEVSTMLFESPLHPDHKLLSIGIKGYEDTFGEGANGTHERPFSNIVFLVDVSGSMYSQDKLPLAQQAMSMLVDESLRDGDYVSIVTYASNVDVVLPPTRVDDGRDDTAAAASGRHKIIDAIFSLKAGGATWGTGGIEEAYRVAEAKFDPDNAINRIIVLTDGDFNLGLTGHDELEDYISSKRSSGIFLSLLGFGMGNYRDETMQALANKGNGVATYIDTLEEARKVMVTEAQSTLFTIAKDVKVQIEFNPRQVSKYRLLGYAKRLLRQEDFDNDYVDAGEIGAGHTVTAFYELLLMTSDEESVNEHPNEKKGEGSSNEQNSMEAQIGLLKIRYKLPLDDDSKLIEKTLSNVALSFELDASRILDIDDDQLLLLYQEFSFATSVVMYGEYLNTLLSDWSQWRVNSTSADKAKTTFDEIIEMAETFMGDDKFGYRQQFIDLVRQTSHIILSSQKSHSSYYNDPTYQMQYGLHRGYS